MIFKKYLYRNQYLPIFKKLFENDEWMDISLSKCHKKIQLAKNMKEKTKVIKNSPHVENCVTSTKKAVKNENIFKIFFENYQILISFHFSTVV